jgi:hypothetical protein
MAAIGIASYEQPWVTCLDVAVDGRCEPAAGKLLLDALEAVRPPNGWRTRAIGTPRSTVYFLARGSERFEGLSARTKVWLGPPRVQQSLADFFAVRPMRARVVRPGEGHRVGNVEFLAREGPGGSRTPL